MKAWLLLICFGCLLFSGQNLAALGDESEREIFKIGEDLTIQPGERVSKALVVGGDAYVDGMVKHEVVAIGGSVFLGAQAHVGGNVTAVGGSIVKQEGAQVGGKLATIQTPNLTPFFTTLARFDLPTFMPQLLQFSGILNFIGLLFIAILVVAIMPETVSHVSAMVEHNLIGSVFWGTLTLIMVIPIAVMLLISLVGIVLIPLEIILVICCCILGYIAAAHLVGKKVWTSLKRPDQSIMFETLLGFVVLFVISWVPFLGWFVITLMVFLGFGGVMAGMMVRRKNLSPE
jgi:hypothetical protein